MCIRLRRDARNGMARERCLPFSGKRWRCRLKLDEVADLQEDESAKHGKIFERLISNLPLYRQFEPCITRTSTATRLQKVMLEPIVPTL